MPPVRPTSSTAGDRIIGLIAPPQLHSASPRERFAAAQSQGWRSRRALARAAAGWPAMSPGAVNAWLVLVTTNPPAWRDPIVPWVERPLTLGEPHEGFFYPDPHGFWAEVRRWATVLLQRAEPSWTVVEALSVSMLLHLEDDDARLPRAIDLARPQVVLFLDEPALERSGTALAVRRPVRIPDPHRTGQVYEGFWGTTGAGTIVGKAPQHPSVHNFYRPSDMDRFLRACPFPAQPSGA